MANKFANNNSVYVNEWLISLNDGSKFDVHCAPSATATKPYGKQELGKQCGPPLGKGNKCLATARDESEEVSIVLFYDRMVSNCRSDLLVRLTLVAIAHKLHLRAKVQNLA